MSVAAQAILDRKASGSVRSPAAAAPPSPHTPQRPGLASTFSSPGGSYRAEDEPVLLEVGARCLRAGFAGSAWAPRCTLGFGLEDSRRVGDYRRWLPGYDPAARPRRDAARWTAEHELWQLDARSSDLGLVQDKLERALREAYSKYLLLEAKSRRVVLVISTSVPHPFLSVILSLLFNNFQVPGVALFPPPAMSVLAAGLRSGLVVDLGWHETVITAIDEFREIHETRSTRAMRLVACHTGRLLDRTRFDKLESEAGDAANDGNRTPTQAHMQNSEDTSPIKTHFEYAEEVLMRMAWCKIPSHTALEERLQKTKLEDGGEAETDEAKADVDPIISIPGPGLSSQSLELRFSQFAEPVEATLLAAPSKNHDDNEQSIPQLIYDTLLALPPDVRGVGMSRITFTGGGAQIPGLRSRLVQDVADLVARRGWDPVQGRTAEQLRRTRPSVDKDLVSTPTSTQPEDAPAPGNTAAAEPQTPDPIADKLHAEATKGVKPTVTGVVRGVDTLGAWVGASLAAALRVKPVVEIEREPFLAQGLGGARRDVESSVAGARPGYGAGLTRPGGTEAAAWTLGAWA